MCAPSHRQLEAAGWFDEPTPASPPPGAGLAAPQLRLVSDGLTAGPSEGSEKLLLQAIAKFDKAVQSRLRDWLELPESGQAPVIPPKVKVIACSLESLFPNVRFEQLLLERLENEKVLDRRKVGDVPAPRVFGFRDFDPSLGGLQLHLTEEIAPTCSLASCYELALKLVSTFPKEGQAVLLDEVRDWPTKLLRGTSIQALSVVTHAAFQGIESAVSQEMLDFIVAATRHGHHICITSPINVWAARWLVAEKLNPMLASCNEPPIPLSCVGGVSSLLQVEGGSLVSEADLASSLSKHTRWNASAFGPLTFTQDHAVQSKWARAIEGAEQSGDSSSPQSGSSQASQKDIDLAFVGPTESADIYARAKRMVVLCDVTSYDPKTSDLVTRTSAFPGSLLVIQPLVGSSFFSAKGSSSLQS